jgi:hypothetical protein
VAPTFAATGEYRMARTTWQQAAELLVRERGAYEIEHPGGTLLQHTKRVGELLRTWGADQDLQAAGFCHACYGTDGFAIGMLALTERQVLTETIGPKAEAIVYLYASCDRQAVYPRLSPSSPVLFTDRFTAVTRCLSDNAAKAWLELTAANELDLVLANPETGSLWAPEFYRLLCAGRRWLSDAALVAWGQTVPPPPQETEDVRREWTSQHR